MFKYFLAAAVALVSTPASAATVTISSERLSLIQEASKSVCKALVESKARASDEFEKRTAYMLLSDSEQLIMLSFCILYTQGRLDELKKA